MVNERRITWLYAATIFVSAFLLFQIQPLISKCLLPWFGGTPNVWTTCLLFFQAVLFGGYVYAHLLSRLLQPAAQALVHLGLLGVTVTLVQILPPSGSRPDPQTAPAPQILLLLSLTVGLPYFLLSTTGPLLQSWFARSLPGASPYRLYALSNAGSLLALVSYPFLVEPQFGMTTQALLWTRAFCLFVLLCGFAAWLVSRVATTPAPTETKSASALVPSPRPTLPAYAGWFALAATASVLLLATTNQVCLDVAVVPFLWVVPLGLYLLTFILSFDCERWYSRRACGLLGGLAMVASTLLMLQSAATSLLLQATVAFTAMFLGCLVCHGELVRRRPTTEYLTAFYLTIAAGGAAGGLFVAVLAPLLFPLYLEMHLAIVACCALTLWVYLDARRESGEATPKLLRVGSAMVTVGVLVALGIQAGGVLTRSLDVRRSFFGVLRVEQEHGQTATETMRLLRYGRILHGMQFVAEDRRQLPTSYYGHGSGIGRVIEQLQRQRSAIRVGVVGLGVGTLAAYGRPNDQFRFYEINPDVIDLAREQFSYLSDCPSSIETVLGDARISLEHEVNQQFDLLVLDAFSGDAVPTHLLTREALSVYQRHLAEGGVLAVHISNLHFDLRPVTASLSELAGLAATVLKFPGDHASGQTGSVWFAASRDPHLFAVPSLAALVDPIPPQRICWTDDFSNLFTLLK